MNESLMRKVEVDGKAVNMVPVAGKMREVVEIDGEAFVDMGKDLVRFYPVRVEVPARGRKVVFVEGGRYRNGLGEAEVLHLRADGTMRVRYVKAFRSEVSEGQLCDYPVKAQAEAVANQDAREEAERVHDRVAVLGSDDMALVRWIAEKGTIRVQMPEKARKTFEEKYWRLSGVKADSSHVRVGDGYWWYGMVAEFPAPAEGSNMAMPSYVNVLSGNGGCQIWSNEFVWALVKSGLKLGRNEAVGVAA